MKIKHPERMVLSLVKTLVFLSLWCLARNFGFAVVLMLLVLPFYKYVIAGLRGYSVMGIQDMLCLYDSDKSVANVASK